MRQLEKGSILIIALWSLLFLASLSVILARAARQKLFFVQRLNERDQAHLAAEAGVKRAIVELMKADSSPGYCSLAEPWSNDPAAFKDVFVGAGLFNVCYNYTENQVSKTRWGMVDEERKINLNAADAAVLSRLFQVVLGVEETEASGLASCIIDWRDEDRELSSPYGAEDVYYEGLSDAYEAKDAPFETLDELLLVKGMNPARFERLKEYLTIYGSGLLNVNTANREALIAVGLDGRLADIVLAFRRGPDDADGTLDDNVFDDPSAIPALISAFRHLGPEEIAMLSNVAAAHLTTDSQYFMINSLAGRPQNKEMGSVVCVVDKKGKVLSWREH